LGTEKGIHQVMWKKKKNRNKEKKLVLGSGYRQGGARTCNGGKKSEKAKIGVTLPQGNEGGGGANEIPKSQEEE